MERPGKPPTMLDVAKEAGVSYTTVSLVVNGTSGRRVSQETRARVLRAIDKLNYQPNIIARSMKTKKSYTIGAIIVDVASTFYAQTLRGIEEVADGHGYHIMVCNTGITPDLERERIKFLIQKQVDGIIFTSHSRPTENGHLLDLVRSGIPLVLINRDLEHPEINSVFIDNVQGAAIAVKHLADLGHRRIAGIMAPLGGPYFCRASMLSFEGYRRGLSDAGLSFDPELVVEEPGLPALEAAGYLLMNRLLDRVVGDRFPTAAYCATDYLAFGAIRALGERGLRVPEDMAIVGHDNTRAGLSITPTLTSVAQPLAEAGRVAARILFERILGTATEAVQMRLPCRLFVRESCGARQGSGVAMDIWKGEGDPGFPLT